MCSSSEHPDVKPGDGFSVHGCSSCSRHLGSHIGKSGHFEDKDGGDDGDCDDDDDGDDDDDDDDDYDCDDGDGDDGDGCDDGDGGDNYSPATPTMKMKIMINNHHHP